MPHKGWQFFPAHGLRTENAVAEIDYRVIGEISDGYTSSLKNFSFARRKCRLPRARRRGQSPQLYLAVSPSGIERLRLYNSFRPNSHRPVTIRQMANAKPKAMLTMKPNGITNRTTMTTAKMLAMKM
jgi:hypothetical protein